MVRVLLAFILVADVAHATCPADSITAIEEGATGTATVYFCDQNGNAASPDVFVYTIRDADTAAVYVPTTTVNTPGTSYAFTIPSVATQVNKLGKPTVYRVISARWNAGDQVTTAEWKYPVTVHQFRPP